MNAEDGGNPALSSSTSLIIDLQDINDNKPVFVDPEVVRLELKEDTPPGIVVHKFLASDLDGGDNGRVTYHLKSGVGGQHFYLDSVTGKPFR